MVNGYRECSLKEAQDIMIEILDKVDLICKKNEINYCLGDGTLLGAVRHSGFIPWDDDIDIWMDRNSYKKFLEIASDELGENYFVQTIQSDSEYNLYHIPCKIRRKDTICIEKGEEKSKYNRGMYIDVFPFDVIPRKGSILYFKFRLNKISVKILRKFKNKKVFAFVVDFIISKIAKYNYDFKIKGDSYVTYGNDTMWYKEIRADMIYPLKKIKFNGKEYNSPNKPERVLNLLYGNYNELPDENERTKHSIYLGIKE